MITIQRTIIIALGTKIYTRLFENNMIWYLYIHKLPHDKTDKVSSLEGLFILSIRVTHYFINCTYSSRY